MPRRLDVVHVAVRESTCLVNVQSQFRDGVVPRRPLGNLVPTRYKIAFRLGALVLVLGGAAMADEPRRRRR